MGTGILIISAMEGAANCGQMIAGQLGVAVEVAVDRAAGLRVLRRQEFAVVLVEAELAESDPQWADQVWYLARLAIPIQVNFAIAGGARLAREVKAALLRRKGERAEARRAAAEEIENDLKSTVTGLLLETELALREPDLTASLEPRLRHLVELAGVLRVRLRGASGHGR
jgi:hypothetical protein